MRLAYACFVDLATYLPWFLICKAIVYPLPNLEDFPDHQTQLPLRFLRFRSPRSFPGLEIPYIPPSLEGESIMCVDSTDNGTFNLSEVVQSRIARQRCELRQHSMESREFC